MFYHVKELQFNARVSKPDPAFATLLLEQFGGANGELKAALQYFVQAFAVKQVHPDKYDLLMDIATEEFSHLEIVGATIQMLLKGIHGDLKNAAEESEIMELLKGKASKEDFIHNAMVNPQFFNLSGGGPTLSDSNGNPWTSAYVTANGDLTVDLRSNIAAESRAKIVYEYLMQHTSDPHVKDTLRFLMTREVAHFQMFQAALETIEPNFPPGVLQSDPKYSNKYFNLSNGEDVRGPWNEGKSPELGETWEYISDPIEHVRKTKGMTEGHDDKKLSRDPKEVDKKNKELSKKKYEEITKAMPKGEAQWSKY
ncbi:manganese catalase family protein [Salinimicrobium sp. TH3]|uniref:manganese catalase family protein n=1 Tax=Salinimicrobium sp. TH3 TaxID=2997342 RepID=UPI0022726C74|nr:manganese catalase family protein [Salinimicrobium sp. TH3]MCY2687112.1 manganese catalase family protein [Salinimicrobium sp. TH3]